MPHMKRLRLPVADDFIALPMALDLEAVLVQPPTSEALPIDAILERARVHRYVVARRR
jgi:hypothetical protein